MYNKNEPVYYPFEGTPLKDWDFTRFNPEFWRHFEQRVLDLLDLGIEADLILFHPFGDEASGGRDWRGKLSRVAIYSRFVGLEEAAQKFKMSKGE